MSVNVFMNGTLKRVAGNAKDVAASSTEFVGTQAEYEASIDEIEDGTIVNITDDLEEGELIGVDVLNRVYSVEEEIDNKVDKKDILSTMEEIDANTNADAIAGANVVKNINDSLNSFCYMNIPVNTEIQNADSQSGFRMYATRQGNIVTIFGRFTVDTGTSLTKGTYRDFAQLPIGYRPRLVQLNFLFFVGINGGFVEGTISADGKITVRPSNKDVENIVYVPVISYFTSDEMPT